ncbi:unnamed protein product [Amoebophrya sp. A120]|nr:unnamed protein product [Amoebophrya sp. A120]|eukprot:GSA120T00001681001.1
MAAPLPTGHSGVKLPKFAPDLTAVEDLDEEPVAFAVAHDGSKGARACIDLAYNQYFPKKPNSTVEIVHIYDTTAQGDLMRPFKKDVIASDITALDIAHGDRFKLLMLEKVEKEGKQLCEWTMKREQKGQCIDFMLMGFKGGKNASEEQLLASDVSYALAYSRCSMIVLRDWVPAEDAPNQKLHYLVPVDLSKWSEKAFHDALVLSSPGDKITVLRVIFEDDADKKSQVAYYEKLIDRVSKKFHKPRNIQLVTVNSGGAGVSETILKWADESETDVDFICMGTNVKRLQQAKSYLGSVSGNVLLKSRYPMVIARYDEDFESVISNASRAKVMFPDKLETSILPKS